MRKRFRFVTSLNVVLLCAAAFSESAFACSPPHPWTPKRAFSEAALVFRGLVTATELSPTKLGSLPTGPEASFTITGASGDGRFLINVRYEIQEVFKGSPRADGLISTTTFIMGGCGVPVLAGQNFLFFVSAVDEETRKAEPELAAQTQGMISIFDTQMLSPDPQQLDEALAEVRALAGKK